MQPPYPITVTGFGTGSKEFDLLPAITVNPSTSVAEVIPRMAGRPVLVVDQDDGTRLVGILTAYDVL